MANCDVEVKVYNNQRYRANRYKGHKTVIASPFPDGTGGANDLAFPIKQWNSLPFGKAEL